MEPDPMRLVIDALEANPELQDALLDEAINGPDLGPAWLRCLEDWRES